MREELLKKIKEDADLLQLLLIVKLNNFTLADRKKGLAKTRISGAFNYISYEDYIYLNYLIEKWKNTNQDNVEEIVNEEIERRLDYLEAQNRKKPTEKEIVEAKEELIEKRLAEHKLYLADLEELKENLDLEFIGKAFYIFYDLVVYSDLIFFLKLGKIVKTIEDHNEEPIATDLKKMLRDLIRTKGKNPIELNKDVIKASLNEEEKEDFNYYFQLCKIGEAIKRVALAHTKGRLFRHPKERVEEEMNSYLLKPNKEDIDTLKQALTSATEEDYTILDTEELLSKLENFIKASISYSRQCDEISLLLEVILKDIRNKYNVAEITLKGDLRSEADIREAIEEQRLLNLEELHKKYNNAKKYLAKIDAKEFLEDAEEDLAIKETLKSLASNDLLEDALNFKPVKDEKDPRNFLESLDLNKEKTNTYELEALEENQENLTLTEEEIKEAKFNIWTKAKFNIWTKTNTSPINSDIKVASQRIANFNEKPIASKIRRLEELEALTEPTEEEILERNELKTEVEALLLEKASLEEKLGQANEDLRELQEDYINEKDPKNKKELGRLIKAINKDKNKLETTIGEKFTKTNSYLQLSQDFTTGAELLVSNEGNIQLTINNNDLRKYNAEVERLAYYIETLFYYTLEEKRDGYYIIDIEDYAEKTGRVVSSKLKKQIEDALEVLVKEEFTIKKEYKGFNIKGIIRRVGDFFTIEPKGTYENIENTSRKTNYVITLEKTYRSILWHNKAQYWASIPSAIMKLKNPLTRGLGFYLYETLKKGIKEPSYYVRKFYIKTIIDALNKRGLLATNTSNKYSRRVIEPLREAFNELRDIGLIGYEEKETNKENMNPFRYYDEYLVGKKGLERAFQERPIFIKFLVFDKDLYDKILETNRKHYIENKKRKTRTKNKQNNN